MEQLIQFIRSLWQNTIAPTIESFNAKNKENSGAIVESINSKKDISVNNTTDISNPIVESIKGIKIPEPKDFPEFPEQKDYSEALKLISSTIIEEIGKLIPEVIVNNDFENVEKLLETGNDKTAILKALEEVKEKIEIPQDYSNFLKEISTKIKGVDTSKIETILESVVKTDDVAQLTKYLNILIEKPIFDLQPFLDENGRLPVAVDKFGGGGGGGGDKNLSNKAGEQINPATEEKQDTQITEAEETNDHLTDIEANLDDLIAINTVSTDFEGTGNITVGTTEVEITLTGATTSIHIQANNSNTGNIYIGKTGVCNDGTNFVWMLESGDEIVIELDDSVNALYARSDTAGQLINVGALL